MSAQWRVLQHIRDIWTQANELVPTNIPIIFAGDIFDIPRPDLPLVRMFRDWMSSCWDQVWSIPGQHDLLHHRVCDISSTGYGFSALGRDLCGLLTEDRDMLTGEKAHYYPTADEREIYPKVELNMHGEPDGPGVYGFGWFQSNNSTDFIERLREEQSIPPIAITHEYVHAGGDTKYEGASKDDHARKLAKRFSGFEFVFCGDNHTPFEHRPAVGPMIINCGALQCRTIKQQDFIPSVILLCEDTKHGGKVPVRINLPVDPNIWAPASVLTLLEKHQAAMVEFTELSQKLDLSAGGTLREMLRVFLQQTDREWMTEDLATILEGGKE